MLFVGFGLCAVMFSAVVLCVCSVSLSHWCAQVYVYIESSISALRTREGVNERLSGEGGRGSRYIYVEQPEQPVCFAIFWWVLRLTPSFTAATLGVLAKSSTIVNDWGGELLYLLYSYNISLDFLGGGVTSPSPCGGGGVILHPPRAP